MMPTRLNAISRRDLAAYLDGDPEQPTRRIRHQRTWRQRHLSHPLTCPCRVCLARYERISATLGTVIRGAIAIALFALVFAAMLGQMGVH